MLSAAVRLLVVLAIASVAFSAVARAQSATFEDPYDVPQAPRPPTLPELTHADDEAVLETTAGALLPSGGGAPTHAYVQRLGLEIPLSMRRWYVGAAYELAGGDAGGGFDVVGGNLELEGRTLWATRTGLALGGGLSLMVPTSDFQDDCPATVQPTAAAAVACSAATLRPWDLTAFVPGAFGVRPFVDVRALDGPLVVQLRQGLDLTIGAASLGDRRLWATLGAYVGWSFVPQAALGLEAFEAYAITVPGVRDDARAAIVVSPSVRLVLPWVQPAISAFTNIGTPLYGAHASIWGLRLAITLVYDPRAPLRVRAQ